MDALSTYLSGQISGLTVLQNFPYANQELNYPSVTITQSNPTRTPEMPWITSQTTPDVNNQITVNTIVAAWEDTFQLDLWCRNNLERDKYLALIIDAFRNNEPNDGLSLQMTNYFNEYARYELESTENVEDEASVQRQERRAKIRLTVNCREVKQKTYYSMAIIQVEAEVATDAADPNFTDDASNTETIVVN